MIAIGIDTETSGTDPKKDKCLELGAVAFDLIKKRPVGFLSFLIDHDIEIPPFITSINGLDKDILDEHGIYPEIAKKRLNKFIDRYEPVCLMAHNAPFDKGFTEAVAGRSLEDFRWVCTWRDLKHKAGLTNLKLVTLAEHYGVKNPFAHGAIADVMTMFAVALNSNIYEVLNIKAPKIAEIKIKVFKEDNQKAKDLGFFYNGRDGHSKKVNEALVDKEVSNARKAGFTVLGVKECLI